jgi:BlaI family transcriptional regulator, penicillinase repressor
MRKKLPRIADTEWLVMEAIWEGSRMTAGQVVEALAGRASWSPRTIKTLLGRLIKKGAIGFDASDRSYVYFPLITREECVRRENETFLARVHGGALPDMISSFLDAKNLSPEEIRELKRILDMKKE